MAMLGVGEGVASAVAACMSGTVSRESTRVKGEMVRDGARTRPTLAFVPMSTLQPSLVPTAVLRATRNAAATARTVQFTNCMFNRPSRAYSSTDCGFPPAEIHSAI